MSYKLEWIFQYRRLLSKATELNVPLTHAEASRLQRLRARLPLSVPELDPSDEPTHLPEPLRAQFVCGGRFHDGQVRNASGDGLALRAEQAPPLGQLLQLHVWDPGHSVEYTFPARVIAAASDGDEAELRLAFEGLPLQTQLISPSMSVRLFEPGRSARRAGARSNPPDRPGLG